MLIEEESVDGGQARLHDGPSVSSRQVLCCWVRTPCGEATLGPHGKVALAKLFAFAVRLQLGPVSKSKRGLVVRAVDLAAIDEGCHPVDLLTCLPPHPSRAKGV